MRRALITLFRQSADHVQEPPEPDTGERALVPWINRWTPSWGRRVWVHAIHEGNRHEVIDAREWIETIHDEKRWPAGTIFQIVTETRDGPPDA